jgi:hypothetical protein
MANDVRMIAILRNIIVTLSYSTSFLHRRASNKQEHPLQRNCALGMKFPSPRDDIELTRQTFDIYLWQRRNDNNTTYVLTLNGDAAGQPAGFCLMALSPSSGCRESVASSGKHLKETDRGVKG